MASSLGPSDVETSAFRRSPSRVFFESDCSSPTSWEFRPLSTCPDSSLQLHTGTTATSPLPMRLSLLRVSATETSTSTLKGDGSMRNSTGSSTGSHRSQDSGFSDSGESRRRLGINGNGSQHSDHLNHSQSPNQRHRVDDDDDDNNNDNANHSERNNNNNNNNNSTTNKYDHLPFIDQTVISSPFQQQLQLQHQAQKQKQKESHKFQQVQYYPNPSQRSSNSSSSASAMVHNNNNNNNSVTYIQLPYDPNAHSPHHLSLPQSQTQNQNESTCANCIYQEVILAQSVNANSSCSALSPAQQPAHLSMSSMDQSVVDFSTPACASTPKRSVQIHSHYNSNNLNHRPSVMSKIDNFESLNKNQKSLDNNNNNSGSTKEKESVESSSSPTYDTVRISNGNANFNSNEGSNSNSNSNSRTNTFSISMVSSSAATVKRISSASSSTSSPSTTKTLSVYSNSSQGKNGTVDSSHHANTHHHHYQHAQIQNCQQPHNHHHHGHHQQHHHHHHQYHHHDQHHRQSSEDWNGNSSHNSGSKSPSADYSSRVNHICSSPKSYQSLPRGFRRVPVTGHGGVGHVPGDRTRSEEVVVKKSHHDNDAMRLWLHELRRQAEPECLYTLQSKAILGVAEFSDGNTNVASASASSSRAHPSQSHPNHTHLHSPSPLNVTTLAIHSVSAPLLSIRNVEEMASVISGEFSKICKHLEFGFFAQVPSLVESLANLLDEFLKHFHESFGNLHKLENRLGASTYELRLAAHALNDLILSSSGIQQQQQQVVSGDENGNGTEDNNTLTDFSYQSFPGSPSQLHSQFQAQAQNIYAVVGHEHEHHFHTVVGEIVENIVLLGNLFGQVVDQRLTRDLSSILETIENGGLPSRVALKSFVTVLSDGGTHICSLAASIRTVRGLLGVLLDAKDDHSKILALRCLATILCIGDAVKDFDKGGGFEIVGDILFDPLYSNAIKYEAVAVAVQVTDPWLDLETTLVNLGFNLEKIIASLTNLIPQCKGNEDVFLLIMAAISNLTFLEVSSVDILRRYRTISLIIQTVEENPNYSVFILDHIATILANMASSEVCRKDIVNNGGIQVLIRFLQFRSTHLESAAEIAACERLQQKSTIAISRLCNEEGVAQMFIEMNGMQRMIQLCRQEKERWYSDGVLLACLATLRKLVTAVGGSGEIVKGFHAQDLVEPRLLDSFLLYSSSRQESYV